MEEYRHHCSGPFSCESVCLCSFLSISLHSRLLPSFPINFHGVPSLAPHLGSVCPVLFTVLSHLTTAFLPTKPAGIFYSSCYWPSLECSSMPLTMPYKPTFNSAPSNSISTQSPHTFYAHAASVLQLVPLPRTPLSPLHHSAYHRISLPND